jgi:hypothetical protein
MLLQLSKNYKSRRKTNKSVFVIRFRSSVVLTFFVFLPSCQKSNEILSTNDTQNVNAESASASYINESADIAISAFSGIDSSQYSTGGTSGLPITGLGQFDDRLGSCATVTLTTTGSTNAPSGMITIAYDTCPDLYGVIRYGTIVITYNGKRWAPGSTVNVRLVHYYRNVDLIEGNLTLTSQASADTLHLLFNSVLDSGKVTFGDGQVMTRTQTFARQWYRSIASSSNNQWITLANAALTGATSIAAGITKGGKAYTIQVTKQLVEKVACRADKVFIPVQGTIMMAVGNEQYTVDYGTGICDKNIISVTLNGKVKQITVTAEGN